MIDVWSQQKQSKLYLIVCIFIVLISGCWGLKIAAQMAYNAPTPDIIAGDPVDAPILVRGLEKTPQFKDTLSWWIGPWVAGADYAFYRPLTSLLFWSEYQVFGRNGLPGFMAIHAISHLLFLLVAFLFLRAIIGLKMATLSVSFFALNISMVTFHMPAGIYALFHWKDGPDIWQSIFYILSLLCFSQYLLAGKKQWYGGAMACFFVALCFKEMAYSVPIALILLLWHQGKLKTHWRAVVPFYLFAGAMFVYRYWALQGMGFRFGTNGAWLQRWFVNVVGGAPAAEVMRGYYWPLVIACSLAAIVWHLAGKNRLGLVMLLVPVIGGIGFSLWESRYLDDPSYYQLVGTLLPWQSAIPTFILLFLFWRFCTQRLPGQIFGWVWVVVLYLPLMTAPITQHALYLVALGWNIWLAYALRDIWKLLKERAAGRAPEAAYQTVS